MKELTPKLTATIEEYILRNRTQREKYKDKHFDMSVKNIEHMRNFATQLMIIGASLAIVAGTDTAILTVHTPLLLLLGRCVLLVLVVYGAIYLKNLLEDENKHLSEQTTNYITQFQKITGAEERLLIKSTEENLINYFKVVQKENERVNKILRQENENENKEDTGVSRMVTILVTGIILIACSYINLPWLQSTITPLLNAIGGCLKFNM